MKIPKQTTPQISQSGASEIGASQVQQSQSLPSSAQSGPVSEAHQFEQGGSLASQLVPNPSTDQAAPQTGQSLLSLQIGQVGANNQVGQVSEPAVNPNLERFEAAAAALTERVEQIQGRITEELRTEDAISSINVGKGEHDYQINVVMDARQTYTPPQVEAAVDRLLHEMGYEGMNINVIEPAVTPFPGFPGGPGSVHLEALANVPAELRAGVSAGVQDFYAGDADKMAEAPNVEGLEHHVLRDKMPVDGPREDIYVDRANNTYFLSSTIVSMLGPEHSGTSWFGPFKLD